MNSYLEVLKKYAVFSGRARRKEFWMFILFNIIIGFALGLIERLAHLPNIHGTGILTLIYNLAILLPFIAVTVRRLHDIDRSGWWSLMLLIPFIGMIVLIIFAIQDSTPDENQYGPNPKEE
ncbi:DUF805 domain-containing protein [Chitinimonas sp. BJB300]|uniref:DUF805 domain-containing protein n=1 Tax=Chitinimonas sp. BJB300 TaxID=1559339 RepID=UPI000C0F1D1A|nr:DUF805 domain-containing protein [Chitinimonas sp. BJB300]PHV11016.1 hypothetical protein CSQ89_13140 [Chitinimonas sp. BJB300]TSJ87005.1 DUF805 domain-containing protein [Chitinimonas sp. BJB300]